MRTSVPLVPFPSWMLHTQHLVALVVCMVVLGVYDTGLASSQKVDSGNEAASGIEVACGIEAVPHKRISSDTEIALGNLE